MRKMLLMILAIAVAGCATTQYHPSTFLSGGYTDKEISPDTYDVSFIGPSRSTDYETVRKFLLYRTAELTLEKGFDYFQVMEAWHSNPALAALGYDNVTESHTVKLHKGEPASIPNSQFFLAKKIIDEYGSLVRPQNEKGGQKSSE